MNFQEYCKHRGYIGLQPDNPRYKIVMQLPEIAEADVDLIYLLPQESESDYSEYIVSDGEWKRIGNADLDLSDYVRKGDLDGYAKSDDLNSYVPIENAAAITKNEIDEICK